MLLCMTEDLGNIKTNNFGWRYLQDIENWTMVLKITLHKIWIKTLDSVFNQVENLLVGISPCEWNNNGQEVYTNNMSCALQWSKNNSGNEYEKWWPNETELTWELSQKSLGN